MTSSKYIIAVLAALLFASIAVCQEGERQRAYDGMWWLSQSSAEQFGFLNGLADCYIYEVKVKPRYKRSVQEDQAFVTHFYRDPSQRKIPVFDVWTRALEEPSPVERTGGEHWDEPHGYFDMGWWVGGTEPEVSLNQKGFVEGFLWCYVHKVPNPRGTFSKSPEEYVRLITNWYETTQNGDEKIADVLFRFRDRARPSGARHK